MRFHTRAISSFSALALLASVSACTTTGDTTTFSTAALGNDASAIAYAVQAIGDMPEVTTHLSPEDKTKFDGLVAQIQSVTAEIAANSNGSVAVNTGKDWAKHLGEDLQSLLTIATPIVKVYYPSAATYMSTVSAMIPLIESLAGVSAVSVRSMPENDAIIRARIYQGV